MLRGRRGPRRFNKKRVLGHVSMRGVRANVNIPTFTKDELAYIATCTNPFGTDSKGGFLARGGKVVDHTGLDTYCVTLTGRQVFAGTASQKRVIKLCKPCSDFGYIGLVAITDDDDTIDTDGAPVAEYVVAADQALAVGTGLCARYRVVGMAVRVRVLTSGDNVVGTFYGGMDADSCANDTKVSDMADLDVNNVYTAKDGITVRWLPESNADFEFADYAAYNRATFCAWRAPVVIVANMSASTSYLAEFVIHYECTGSQSKRGIAVAPSPVSLRWDLIYALVSDRGFAPIVSKGNTLYDAFRGPGFSRKLHGFVSKRVGMRKAAHRFGGARKVFRKKRFGGRFRKRRGLGLGWRLGRSRRRRFGRPIRRPLF